MNTRDFFNTIFNEQESTCFSKHAKGTKVFDVDDQLDYVQTWAEFFCLNPLHPFRDLNPTEEYHHADKPRRADANVMVYRNILIEMDSMPIEDQPAYIEAIGLPYTTCTYSGGKSNHYIISLETPCVDEKAYRILVERVFMAMGGKTVVDVACKNPSRLTRFPGAIRSDKQKEQKLLAVNDRVKNEVLEAWLMSKGAKEPAPQAPKKSFTGKTYTGEFDNSISSKRAMNGFTLNFIMCGANEGERNQSLFKAACDLTKCGYEEDEIYDRLAGPSGLDDSEIKRTITSAMRKVESEQ